MAKIPGIKSWDNIFAELQAHVDQTIRINSHDFDQAWGRALDGPFQSRLRNVYLDAICQAELDRQALSKLAKTVTRNGIRPGPIWVIGVMGLPCAGERRAALASQYDRPADWYRLRALWAAIDE